MFETKTQLDPYENMASKSPRVELRLEKTVFQPASLPHVSYTDSRFSDPSSPCKAIITFISESQNLPAGSSLSGTQKGGGWWAGGRGGQVWSPAADMFGRKGPKQTRSRCASLFVCRSACLLLSRAPTQRSLRTQQRSLQHYSGHRQSLADADEF